LGHATWHFRVNLIGWYIYATGAAMMLWSFSAADDTCWTFYAVQQ
jgi:hypothetical protein